MTTLSLFCKSYRTDLRRVVRLAESVQRFNRDNIPFVISVPESDLPLFREHVPHGSVIVIADQEIVERLPSGANNIVNSMPGHLSQQVIKSEYWRLGLSDAYVCLDSDAIFIREFFELDFLAPDGVPYTMIDEAHDLLEPALQSGRRKVQVDFNREADLVQKLFDRKGRRYSFGPFPLVWHRAVWESLYSEYLSPRGMNFSDAIALTPIESRWYGEALLAFQAIRLLPCQALFKVYHYAWQLDRDRRAGIFHEDLKQLYCGVIYQSSWERSMDWPSEGGNILSRTGRRIRRYLGRI